MYNAGCRENMLPCRLQRLRPYRLQRYRYIYIYIYICVHVPCRLQRLRSIAYRDIVRQCGTSNSVAQRASVTYCGVLFAALALQGPDMVACSGCIRTCFAAIVVSKGAVWTFGARPWLWRRTSGTCPKTRTPILRSSVPATDGLGHAR